MKRSAPNKSRSVKNFKNRAAKTAKANTIAPSRGGIRL